MLERIEIENLGSIRKAELTLSPLTVLLGANASGKTTVMRGIELFAALRSEPLPEAKFADFALTGSSWPKLIHGGEVSHRLGFRASVQPTPSEPDYEMQIGINWERVGSSIVAQAGEVQPEPEFLAERLRDPGRSWIERGTGAYKLRERQVGLQGPQTTSIAHTVARLGSVLPTARTELDGLIQFVESFGAAHYFRPNSSAMLSYTFKSTVWPDGSGFIPALATLQNRESERFEAIEQRLSTLFPHIQRVRFEIGAEGKIQRLVFETRRSKQLVPAALEAEGVLTTLFLLWAGATTPPHGTLLIDEPETALHPHLMGRRVEFLRSLANGGVTGHPLRVVVATQSVDFVRWLEPAELRVVEYSPGTGTLIHAIPESETLHTLTDKFQTNTGDLWYSGALGGVPGTGA